MKYVAREEKMDKTLKVKDLLKGVRKGNVLGVQTEIKNVALVNIIG